MTFQNPNVEHSFNQKCLDLPKYTSFVTDGELCKIDSNTIGYSAINPMELGKIKIGNYIFRNISPAGETFPKICVFYKSD